MAKIRSISYYAIIRFIWSYYSIYDALSQFNDDPCKLNVSHLNLRKWKKLKLPPSAKSATTADIYLSSQKNTRTRSSVECWDHCDKIKYTQHQLLFIVKFKLLKKSSKYCMSDLGVTKHHTGVKIYGKQQIILCWNCYSSKLKKW